MKLHDNPYVIALCLTNNIAPILIYRAYFANCMYKGLDIYFGHLTTSLRHNSTAFRNAIKVTQFFELSVRTIDGIVAGMSRAAMKSK